MQWFVKLASKPTPRPPAYALERISDLDFASKVSKTAPGDAKEILAYVATSLRKHNDEDYARLVQDAAQIILDSPSKARRMIENVILKMNSARKRLSREKKNERRKRQI